MGSDYIQVGDCGSAYSSKVNQVSCVTRVRIHAPGIEGPVGRGDDTLDYSVAERIGDLHGLHIKIVR